MKKPKHPCPRYCPDRKVGCRETCKEWIEYEAAMVEFRKARDEIYRNIGDICDYTAHSMTKNIKHKRGK